eukprot:607122-Pelagomonas_calceolata.AAC.2
MQALDHKSLALHNPSKTTCQLAWFYWCETGKTSNWSRKNLHGPSMENADICGAISNGAHMAAMLTEAGQSKLRQVRLGSLLHLLATECPS